MTYIPYVEVVGVRGFVHLHWCFLCPGSFSPKIDKVPTPPNLSWGTKRLYPLKHCPVWHLLVYLCWEYFLWGYQCNLKNFHDLWIGILIFDKPSLVIDFIESKRMCLKSRVYITCVQSIQYIQYTVYATQNPSSIKCLNFHVNHFSLGKNYIAKT